MRAKDLELHRVEQQLRSTQAELHKRDLAAKAMRMESQRREGAAATDRRQQDARPLPQSTPAVSSYRAEPAAAPAAARATLGQPAGGGGRASAAVATPVQPAAITRLQQAGVGGGDARNWPATPMTPPSPLGGDGEPSDVSELLAACNAYVDNIVSVRRLL